MAEIALSAYLEEINTLIDEGRPSEAIIHARHILEKYPRQLDTYRLLAKALLEQGEHADAADLFQRVLSAYPDDFIAHAGLAIVRKEENKLDQALWHMERAFEVEPYNAAIRSELKDLYERRDGTAPERLALTRAALARLYVNGAMYQQAEAELRAILAEVEQRIDLQVLLAEALWRDEQRVDAAELCLHILKQLPNCIDANAILAEVWLLTGRVEEAQPYLERLRSLTQISQMDLAGDTAVVRAFQAEGVEPLPNKVLLEKLPEQVALGITAGDEPGGVEEVGLEIDELEDDFDWLRALERSEQGGAGTGEGAQPETTADEREADWHADEEEVERETPAPPDWLQVFDDDEADLADASAWLSETGGEMEDLAGEETDWEEWLEADSTAADTGAEVMRDSPAQSSDLEETPSGDEEDALLGQSLEEAETETNATDSLETEFSERLESVVPDDDFELEEVQMGTSEERKNRPEDEAADTGAEATPTEDLDWLNELATADAQEEPSASAEGDAVPTSAEDIPDWLRDDVEVEAATGDSLDWLEESESEGTPHVDEPLAELPESEVDDSLPNEEQVEPDEDLSWLDQIAAGQGEAIEEPPTFSWPEEGEDEEVEAVTPSAAESAVDAAAADDEEGEFWAEGEEPDWLGDVEEPAEEETGAVAAFAADEDEDDLDWLRDLDADEEEEADWLSGVVGEEPVGYEDEPEGEVAPASEFEAEGDEEELDWLGEAEIEEDEAEDVPEWLRDVPEEEPAGLAGEPPVEATAAADFEAEGDEEELDWLGDLDEEDEEIPDWLSEMAEEELATVTEQPATEAPAAADFEAEEGEAELDELEDLQAEAEEAPELEAPEEAVGAEPLPVDEEAEGELPDWLVGLETEEEGLERAAEDSALRAQLMASEGLDVEEELPDDETAEAGVEDFLETEAEGEAAELEWLNDLAEEESVPEMRAEDQALRAEMANAAAPPAGEEPTADDVPEDLEEAMAWLEQLAAQQGAPLDELPSLHEGDIEAVPAWLQDVADEDEIDELLDELPDDREEALDYLEELAEEAGGEEIEIELPAAKSEAETSLPEPEEDLAWMETLVEAGEEGAVAGAEAEEPAPVGEEVEEAGEAPEDLEEAMAWLEQLAAQQGAPLDELPSVQETAAAVPEVDEVGTEEPAAAEWTEEAEPEQEFAVADEESDLAAALAAAEAAEPQEAVVMEEEGAAPVAGTTAEEEEEVDEAMAWLDRLAAEEELVADEEARPVSEQASALSAEIPDDLDQALAWLEQLAGRPETKVSSEPAYADEEMAAVEEQVTPAVPHDVVKARIEAEMIQRQRAEDESAEVEVEVDEFEITTTDAVVEEEMLADIPEDPDEAMAWLEQLAARQGASLDELPSVEEMVDEVALPEWLAQEVEEAAAEEAAQTAAQQAAEDTADEEDEEAFWEDEQAALDVEESDDLGWLDEMLQEEVVSPLVDEEPSAVEPPVTTEPEAEAEELADEEVEEPLPSFDFDLPEADIDDSLPDWLAFDESGEIDDGDWDETEADISGWLTAEEEVTLHGPEETLFDEEGVGLPEPEVKPEPESSAVPPTAPPSLSLPEIPPGVDLDREQLTIAREAIASGDYDQAVDAYQTLLDSGEGLGMLIVDLEVAAAGVEQQPLLLRLLGDAYMQNGQLHKALASYREALDML